jgi:hypothetical protein
MWSVPDVNHVSGTDLRPLACPARFERATYALEALKISRNNSFKVLVIGVAQHREPGVGWNSLAIGWHPQAARWLVV